MTEPTRVTNPADLRLMPFGRTRIRDVRDGLWEPLWAGQRVLVDVLGGRVGIRDEHNDLLEGFDLLREAILWCSQADELVLDGYLMPGPLRDTEGVGALPGTDAIKSAGAVGRHFLVGGGGKAAERREAERAASAQRSLLEPTAPAALVAVDLLWLDGEPLLDVPLLERKRLLDSVLVNAELVRRTVAVRPPVERWFLQWKAMGFLELAVKDVNSRYTPGQPSKGWATDLIPKR